VQQFYTYCKENTESVAALSRMPIAFIDISFFAHATEDENKVIEAVRHLLPKAQADNIVFHKSGLRGHYGNPIALFEAKIKEKDVLEAFMENLASNLGVLDKETLLREISLHVEKGSLYLRFDKQAAFQGAFKLGVADPIRVRLRFKKNRLEDVVQVCREIGMLP
jgi:RNA binding exosome subunit